MFSKKVLTGMLAAIMALPLAGCGFFAPQGPHAPAELQDFEPLVKAKVSWSRNVGDNSGHLVPAVTDNAVYAAGENKVYRLDRNTGDEVWSVKTGADVTAGVGTDGNYLAVVTELGELEVYDAEGSLAWKVRLSAETQIAPLVGQGLVVVSTADTRVTAFDLITGQRAWHYQGQTAALTVNTFKQMCWSPAGILIGQANGRLLALGADGRVVFDAVIGQAHGITEVERLIDVVGRPWVDQQLMCASAYQGGVVCMGAMNGRPVWDTKVSAVTGPVSDAQLMYVVDEEGYIHAYNRFNGREAWVNTDFKYREVAQPIRVGGTLAVADLEGVVSLLNPSNGLVVGRTALDGAVRAPAAQHGYGAIFQTVEGQVAYVLQESLED